MLRRGRGGGAGVGVGGRRIVVMRIMSGMRGGVEAGGRGGMIIIEVVGGGGGREEGGGGCLDIGSDWIIFGMREREGWACEYYLR